MNNFALVGLGYISQRHIQAIQDTGNKLLMVCDIDESKKKIVSNAIFNSNYIKMAKDPLFKEVDYVVIATPNHLHFLMVIFFLKMGKKVLCEKPLVIDPEHLEILERLPMKKNLSVVLQLRYNPKIDAIKSSEEFKDIFIKVQAYREKEYWDSWKGNPELSGGILMNMGVHYIDLLIHILGEPIEILSSNYSERKAAGIIKFKNGKGTYKIEFLDKPQETIRKININGEEMDLEGATLSLKGDTTQNLHAIVYQNLNNGIPISEARKSLDLINLLKSRRLKTI